MESNTPANELLDALFSFASDWQIVEEEAKVRQEKLWEGLSQEDRLDLFCHIVRLLCKGELEDQGTYRYVLYHVFGFGPEAYVRAQMAGFLDLHNSIHAADHDIRLLEAFCKKHNIPLAENKIKNWWL